MYKNNPPANVFFVRQGELRQAKWEDINFETKEWRLPPHTTKMKDLHIVPLAKQTIKLLKEIKAIAGSATSLSVKPCGPKEAFCCGCQVPRIPPDLTQDRECPCCLGRAYRYGFLIN